MTKNVSSAGSARASPDRPNAAERSRVDRLLPLAVFLLLIAAASVIYSTGLGGPLVLDDQPQLGPYFETSANPGFFSQSGFLGRPLAMATFAFDARISGPDAAAWKVTNVLLHLLAAACVAGFMLNVTAGYTHSTTMGPRFAILAAALWLLHPLHASTVLYLVQRMAELSALFCFAGLWCYAAGRRRQLRGEPGAALVAGGYVVFLPLAALSKENGILLPVFLLALEACVFRFGGSPSVRRAIRALHAGAAGLALAAAAGSLLHFAPAVQAGYAGAAFTLGERLLTELRVVVLYLRMILLPWPGFMGFYHDDLALSAGLLSPPTTLLSLVALVALAASAWVVRRRWPLATFGIALFFVGHLLESTIFPLELMFEHRNYLPSFGLLLAAITLADALPARGRVRVAFAAAVLGAFAALLHLHVRAWSSTEALYSFIARTHPDSPGLVADVAGRRADQGDYAGALAALDGRTHPGARLQRAYVLCLRDGGLPRGALAALGQALDRPIDHYTGAGLMELGRAGLEGGCRIDRREYLQLQAAALARPARDAALRGKLLLWTAHYQWALQEHAAAFATLDAAARADPRDAVPLFLAAHWALDLGDRARAAAFYEQARTIAAASRRDSAQLLAETEARLAAPPASGR